MDNRKGKLNHPNPNPQACMLQKLWFQFTMAMRIRLGRTDSTMKLKNKPVFYKLLGHSKHIHTLSYSIPGNQVAN